MILPPKSTFKFQELPAITGIKPYVLRFWETEFEEIVPIADEAGEKHYSRADVELILHIKSLLFDKKLSITEAKGALRSQAPELSPGPSAAVGESQEAEVLASLREALQVLKEVRQRHHW